MKPLYLNGSGLRVERDGAALKVSQKEKSDIWFPYRRISRVVSDRCVDWGMDALMGCAETGITVTFLNDEGGIFARMVGKQGEAQTFHQKMRDFLGRPDWSDHYLNWKTAMKRMAVRSVLRRLAIRGSEQQEMSESMMRNIEYYPASSAEHQRIFQLLRSLLHSQVMQILQSHGANPEYHGWDDIDLTCDIAEILSYDFVPAVMRWEGELAREDIVKMMENRRLRVEELVGGLLVRLVRIMQMA